MIAILHSVILFPASKYDKCIYSDDSKIYVMSNVFLNDTDIYTNVCYSKDEIQIFS